MAEGTLAAADEDMGFVGRIPVRNLWLLMLYASDLFRCAGAASVAVEENPDDIPELVAEILAHAVERRLRRRLGQGYETREAVLHRVRGRIDVLGTERHQLLSRGAVACRFDELTVDTPRNRFVRAALERIAGLVKRAKLAHRCRVAAATMRAMGVSGLPPSVRELANQRFGRHDAGDRMMVAAAKLAFELALPTEVAGPSTLLHPEREEAWVRNLFERAVGGFYDVVLRPDGWDVHRGRRLDWQMGRKTSGIGKLLPGMKTDVILEHPISNRRIVIDTKFTSILKSGHHREETFDSGYLYQIYAYLLSQRGTDALAATATGTLLHPSVGVDVDEAVEIQGHTVRFATVDLQGPAQAIRDRLLAIVLPAFPAMALEGSLG